MSTHAAEVHEPVFVGETLAKLEALYPKYPNKMALLLPTLWLVQEARKSSGLAVSDRIALWWSSDDPDLAAALREHGGLLGDEVLATSYVEGEPGGEGTAAFADDDLALRFWLRKA